MAVVFWISFFTLRTYWQTFLLRNFTMTRPCLPTRWHASMSFPGTSSQLSPNFLEKVFSKSLTGTLWGIPVISTRSCLGYWALAQHCLSMFTSRSDNSLLMLLDRASYPSSLLTHSFHFLTSSITSCWIDSFFSWRFIENTVTDSSHNFAMVKNS